MATTFVQISLLILQSFICMNCEKFGYKDSLTCHCDGGTCDKETGICSSGKCQQGWSGPSCQRQNVALNKPATQSSYYVKPYPGISEDVMSGYAVDGDTSHESILGLNPPDQSKCVDMLIQGNGWWTVDLQQTYHLNTIKIYHREEGWLTRFTRASVNIIDEDGQSSKCYQNEQQPTSPVFTINCVGTGRYLNFTQSTGEGILNLCEIEVYVCSVGTFGSECTKFCHCKKNTRCDDVTGSCPDGCLPGWEGESCNQSCSDTRYGNACRSRCVDRNCFGNYPCDHVTGNCTRGCKQGFMGADCMLSCSDTYTYGDACRSRCVDRNCYGNSSCDHVTGNCTDGCKHGFMGVDCRNCDQGFYGDGCKLNCTERKCLNMTSSCDHVIGTCDEGCQEGYNGDDCTKRVEKNGQGTTIRSPPIDVIAGSIVAVIVVIILVILGVVLYKRYQRRRENVYNKPNTISDVATYDTLSPTSPNEGNTTPNSSSQDNINTNGASEGEITPTSVTSDGITNHGYYNTPALNGAATAVAVNGTNNIDADDIGYYNVDNIGQTKRNDKTVSDAVKDENIYVDIED